MCEQDTEIVPKLISDDILLKYMFVHPFWLHWLESSLFHSNYLISCSAAFHSDFKWLKLARNKFTKCDSRSFNELFLQIYIVFGHCLGYISNFVKLLKSQLWSVNFTNFSSRVFSGFLTIGPIVPSAACHIPLWKSCRNSTTIAFACALVAEALYLESWDQLSNLIKCKISVWCIRHNKQDLEAFDLLTRAISNY